MFLFPLLATLLVATRWSLFQEDRFLGKVLDEWIADSQEFVHSKLPKLIVIAIIAFVLSRLLRIATFHMTRLAEQRAAGPARFGEAKTMAGVIRATGVAVIVLIAGFMSLDTIGFNLAPLLASAGIAGIAIGLAAQTIVKDMLNGFLILVEGQFSVGDTVRLAGVSGVVEALTLRRTTVRDGDGTLYVIPNSQITTVANLNAGYSIATINVSVDFSANPDEVTKLLKEIAMEVRNSAEYRDIFLQGPQVLGLDSVKGSQMIFPVLFKTRANQQYAPVREFQRRVRLALEEDHILPGDPGRVFQPHNDAKAADTPRQPEEASTSKHDPTTIKPQESNPFSGD
ncbi:MAG: mechanosensitive ion channel family protein [Terracidiphilus sp.]|jgi:small conductance mechanosensitive channel